MTQEEYVRRNASPEEVEQLLDNPRLVRPLGKGWWGFSFGKLDLHARQRKSGGTLSTSRRPRLSERLRLEEGLRFVEMELSPEVSV